MERNGGNIAVTSMGPGSGCTFTVTVPAYHARASTSSVDNSTASKRDNNNIDNARSAREGLVSSARDGDGDGALMCDAEMSISRSVAGDVVAILTAMESGESPFVSSALTSWVKQKKPSRRRVGVEPRAVSMSIAEDPRVEAIIASTYERLQADRVSIFVYNEMTKKLHCVISQDITGLVVDAHNGFVGE